MSETQPESPNEQLVASEENLEERLKFETLLANMSMRFVNLPADRLDGESEDAQRLSDSDLGIVFMGFLQEV